MDEEGEAIRGAVAELLERRQRVLADPLRGEPEGVQPKEEGPV